jgi:hypothetical protein
VDEACGWGGPTGMRDERARRGRGEGEEDDKRAREHGGPAGRRRTPVQLYSSAQAPSLVEIEDSAISKVKKVLRERRGAQGYPATGAEVQDWTNIPRLVQPVNFQGPLIKITIG